MPVHGVSNEKYNDPATLTRLAVAGYKSVAKRQEIEIRPLTILAGTNSSGKSSIIQPLLLLKQTLEETYDPGALLINGPNVRFTNADEILSKNSQGEEGSKFTVELHSQTEAIANRFIKRKKQPFGIESTEKLIEKERIIIRSTSNPDSLIKQVVNYQKSLQRDGGVFGTYDAPFDTDQTPIKVRRNRCFLEVGVAQGKHEISIGGQKHTYSARINLAPGAHFSPIIRSIIHLPGLRGNPERTYPVTAVGKDFPGSFDKYVASVIAAQQVAKKLEWIHNVGSDLLALGLTWKVVATPIHEAQVSLQVGRLPKGAVGGARDLVSIADVGVGVSQVLPVVVALEIARAGQIVYIEQPEIHLHPRAQEALANILGRAAKRGVRVIIETHSDLLILGVQSSVAKGELSPDLVALHWFEREEGATKVTSAHLDETGAFGEWPVDFGDVRLQAEDRFLSAAENKLRQT